MLATTDESASDVAVLVDRATASLMAMTMAEACGQPTAHWSRRRVLAESPPLPVPGPQLLPDAGEWAELPAAHAVLRFGAFLAERGSRWRTDPDVGSQAAEVFRAGVIGPVCLGLTMPCEPLAPLVEAVSAVCGHVSGTRLEHGGAAAIAAAVSAGLDGSDLAEACSLAMAAADQAGMNGEDLPGPDLATRIHWATRLCAQTSSEPLEVLDLLVGTSTAVQESVPAGFALANRYGPEPERLCRLAAELGGAPVVGMTAAAIAGACAGTEGIPGAAASLAQDLSGSLEIARLAIDLIDQRRPGGEGQEVR